MELRKWVVYRTLVTLQILKNAEVELTVENVIDVAASKTLIISSDTVDREW